MSYNDFTKAFQSAPEVFEQYMEKTGQSEVTVYNQIAKFAENKKLLVRPNGIAGKRVV